MEPIFNKKIQRYQTEDRTRSNGQKRLISNKFPELLGTRKNNLQIDH